jgi:hypothetical protein
MEVIEVIIGEIFKIVVGGISFSIKFFNIILWAMVGALILPMVFVSGNLYPLWEKWAESLRK